MLISLNWLSDFVSLPHDLDPRALAERFTVTVAEVEGIEHLTTTASGLIAARIERVEPIPGSGSLYAVSLEVGGRSLDSVTAAPGLATGQFIIYAPAGASLPEIGAVGVRQAHGRTSEGMIVAGDSLGLPTVGQHAIFLPPSTKPGEPIDMALFDDWVMEVDNKSITHRPDLWGHYGIAREMAAMFATPLGGYPVVPLAELAEADLPEIPITIDDPARCPRYSALRFTGVRPQPAPLRMQVRLAHVGLRPIDILVDLTNYIMAELGQPMHAFDGSRIDRIEVALAKAGEKFRTLDGLDRTMPEGALMIQCNRRSVALAGIMGGADTEITPKTNDLLLESANFDAATIRRCAVALGHRTDASARFEKSQDPHNTVLGIQRFVKLARPELPDMRLTSRLSDAFPLPPAPINVTVQPDYVRRYLGRPVETAEMVRILESLQFGVAEVGGLLEVAVPTFRATKDISIEPDVIEEIARFVGYGSITPTVPEVTVRYAAPAAISRLERRTLALLCGGMSYAEVHRYIWFDDAWLKTLGYEPGPTIGLRNPAAAGSERLRTTLLPGLLAVVDLNRRNFDRFEIVEVGSAFMPDKVERPEQAERRRLAIVLVAPGRKPAQEDALLARLKTDLETWAAQVLEGELAYSAAVASVPWEHEAKTASVVMDGRTVGRLTAVPAACKRAMDEHLAAWSIVLAEVDLDPLAERKPPVRKLAAIPVYPQINVDFSVLTDAGVRYEAIRGHLAGYAHPLLSRLAFVDSYEGGSVPAGKRSFTLRATIGDPSRTLGESDIQSFREAFIAHLSAAGLTLRQ